MSIELYNLSNSKINNPRDILPIKNLYFAIKHKTKVNIFIFKWKNVNLTLNNNMFYKIFPYKSSSEIPLIFFPLI